MKHVDYEAGNRRRATIELISMIVIVAILLCLAFFVGMKTTTAEKVQPIKVIFADTSGWTVKVTPSPFFVGPIKMRHVTAVQKPKILAGKKMRHVTQKLPADTSGLEVLNGEAKNTFSLSENDIALLTRIGYPESGWQQFRSDGSVKVNPSGHVGIFQLSRKYHAAKALKYGTTIDTVRGNVLVAVEIYKQQGTTPWLASSRSWKN